MSALELLKQATRRVLEESGETWPDDADAKFDDPSVARMADVFSDLVLTEHATDLEREAHLMRARMDRLQAERDGIVLAVIERLERACGATGMPPLLIRREFLPEPPCVQHLPAEDTEGGAA